MTHLPSGSAPAAALTLIAVLMTSGSGWNALAQPPGPLMQDDRPAREAAPIDLTGQWVAIVNEDWRWRMVTPPKGDYASVPLNAEGRGAADEWDPSQDGGCEAYGAAALLRLPTRMRIEWDGDETLRLETDAGQQTRSFAFGAAAAPSASGPPSLQGRSVAEWVRPTPRPGGPGLSGAGGGGAQTGGYLKVTTTNLSGGWLRRNGVPYSAEAVVTEYFDGFPSTNGDAWLMVTTIVEDPRYLNTRYVTSSHFKRESDESNWNPTACVAR